MRDDDVDALVRRLDVGSNPDPMFVKASLEVLRPRVQAMRAHDARRLGRLWRDLRAALALDAWPSAARPLALLALVCLLMLAVLAALVVGGRRNDTFPGSNGALIVSVGGALQAIDVDTGETRPIGPPGEQAVHVSRSPDGRRVAFWQTGSGTDALFVMGIDSSARRRLGSDQRVAVSGCVDAWSPDSRYLASEVVAGATSRILVADVATGSAHFITPEGVVAHCPLWSPDGKWLAFVLEAASGARSLAIIRADGTAMHEVSGDLGGEVVDGPDTWSPDGAWIYFNTERSIWRANVVLGRSSRLTDPRSLAVAPTSSPDGSLISYIISTTAGWDLYVANSDGTAAHRILEQARNLGWSADGRYVLARWTPLDREGGLVVVTPAGTGFRMVLPSGCPKDGSCDVGWGQARP